MKIRNGFVSNSSSTSFVFVFKDGELPDAMKKHESYFNLSHEGYNDEMYFCNHEEVLKCLEEIPAVDAGEYCNKLIEEIEERKKDYKIYMSEFPSLVNYVKEDIDKMNLRLKKIKSKMKKGFNKVITVGFGDNHGDFSGDGIGCVMDYEGRYISIDDNSLYVETEQNR